MYPHGRLLDQGQGQGNATCCMETFQTC